MILLSYPINNDIPMYGGSNLPEINNTKNMLAGDSCNMMNITISNHTGTHIDCPFHFDPKGKTLSDYSADFWFVNDVGVFELTSLPEPESLISPNELRQLSLDLYARSLKMLILKTGYCYLRHRKEYWQNPPGIHPELPDFLREYFPKICFLGFDLISVSSFAHRNIGRQAHKAFLSHKHPILPIEDMNLTTIPAKGIDNILIAPLYIDKADGAPCTVFGNIECI